MTDLSITTKRLDENEMVGLHQNWLEGEGDGVTFSLNSGAGLGSPALSLTIEMDGQRITEVIDVRDLARQWVDAIRASLPIESTTITRLED